MTLDADTADLVFVHLSDIHFREGQTGDLHDGDTALRHELQIDLRRLLARVQVASVDGLLISGDIAFGGRQGEFEYAEGWIESVREQLGCKLEDIMITPGNHDADRELVKNDGDVDLLHQEIRSKVSTQERDQKLAQILRNEDNGVRLMSPLNTYNKFAKKYGCAVSRTHPYWERDFRLGDGTTLRFRGVTTTFLSGPRDDVQTHRMMYGSAQRMILRDPNVRYAIVGHHPPSWSLDGDDADDQYAALTFLQVYGHKHSQWVTRLGNSVRLIAGALHPSRLEQQWLPRYSAFGVTAVDDCKLKLRIYPRRWSDEDKTFIPDFNLPGQDWREFILPVSCREGGGLP